MSKRGAGLEKEGKKIDVGGPPKPKKEKKVAMSRSGALKGRTEHW